MDTSVRKENMPDHTLGIDFKNKGTRGMVITIIISLLLITGLWIWKSLQLKNLKEEAAAQQLQLNEKAQSQMRTIDQNNLEVLAKPFVWAIRTEMLKNNVSQIALYINDIVKDHHFQKINIVNESGIVILSTNKKEEGSQSTMAVGEVSLSANTTAVTLTNDTTMTVSSPIMGFNERLGTLLINYSSRHRALLD